MELGWNAEFRTLKRCMNCIRENIFALFTMSVERMKFQAAWKVTILTVEIATDAYNYSGFPITIRIFRSQSAVFLPEAVY